MSAMENRDEVLQLLERFTRLKQKEIPRELEDYLTFVARTGDTVYPWAAVKYFFRTKLSHVIMDFHDNTPSIADLPQCPNVDPFCYDRMKRTLLSRMESFNSAPFTIQRICELLNEPRKHYTRIDKFMRAVEKNILVVSTQEPGRRRSDSENGDSLDSIVNGDLEVNVDIEMDNEAFGIDANEMTSNASVAAVVPPVNVTTPAHAEEVPPTMEPAEEQDAEKQLADDEPKLAAAESDVNDSKPEETVPLEVNGNDKDASEATEEVAAPAEKLPYSADDDIHTPEASSLEHPTVEPPPDVIDSAPAVVHEQKELDEHVPAEEPTTATESTPESPDTTHQTSSSAEPPVLATTAESEAEPVEDGEPKAKMVKLSQEESEIEPSASESLAEEPTTETEPADPVSAAVVATSTEELSESDVVSVFPSTESLQSVEPEVTSHSSIFSTEDHPSAGSSTVSIAGTVSTDSISASSVTAGEDVAPSALETPTEPEEPTTVDEPKTAVAATSEQPTPSEPSEVAPIEEEEPAVKSDDLEVHPASEEAPEQPPTAQTNPDDMETVPSAAVPENVMATDEEEHQPHPEVADSVVPMAADASEAAKPDENAMDIDESSVEPMDQ